jgi:hypothetical protein
MTMAIFYPALRVLAPRNCLRAAMLSRRRVPPRDRGSRRPDDLCDPLSGTWVVDGPLVADQIYAGIRPLLHASDRLVIVNAGMEALWHGVSKENARWLATNFPASLSEHIPGKTEGLTP